MSRARLTYFSRLAFLDYNQGSFLFPTRFGLRLVWVKPIDMPSQIYATTVDLQKKSSASWKGLRGSGNGSI